MTHTPDTRNVGATHQVDADDALIASTLHEKVPTGFSRRRFLQLAAGGVAGAALVAAMPELEAYAAPPSGTDGLLLSVWLGGGNDGLNMLAPVDDGRYRDLRGSIALDPAKALRIDNGLAFHPAMKWTQAQYALGSVAVLAGVGAANYDLSHFQMADNVLRGAADQQAATTTGWIGRWMDANPAATALTSVSLGGSTPAHMLGQRLRGATMPLSLPWNSIAGLSQWDVPSRQVGNQVRAIARSASPLGALADAAACANVDGLDLNTTLISQYGPIGNDWSTNRSFRVAARLFGSGVGIRVAHVTLGGFDSHVGQGWMQDTALTRLDNGLKAFFTELDPALAGRVSVIVFSEFGRTPRANGNGGTDHGTASTWLAIGPRIRGGVYGALPNLNALDSSGYFKPMLDLRDVWATLTETWLGGDPAVVLGAGRRNLGFAGDPTGGPALAPAPPPPPVVVPTPAPPPPPTVAVREVWSGVAGGTLGAVAVGTPPTSSEPISSLDVPSNVADNYATRVRTLINVPATGDWTFWIASDDNGMLLLSNDTSRTSTRLVAWVDSWVGARSFDQLPSQCSGPIRLEAGKRYYLEACFKEGGGGDHLAVAVAGPGVRRQLLPGDWCTPPGDTGAGGWNPHPGVGAVQVERWQHTAAVWALSTIKNGAAPTSSLRNARMVTPGEAISNLATRHRAWLTVPTSGQWVFAAAAPSGVRVNIASGERRTDSLRTIIDVTTWASAHRYDRPGQVSAPVTLEAGVRYYVEVWAAHGDRAESLTVAAGLLGQPLTAIPVRWWSDCGSNGSGPWDPSGASTATAVLPTEPRNLAVSSTGTAATVTFDAPMTSGSSPVSGYLVKATSATGVVRETRVSKSPTTLSALPVGSRWTVSVAAVSNAGTGPACAPASISVASSSGAIAGPSVGVAATDPASISMPGSGAMLPAPVGG